MSGAKLFGHSAVLRSVDIVPQALSKEVIREGVGTAHPQKGQTVTAHYVGKLVDGTDFDASRKRGRPFQVS